MIGSEADVRAWYTFAATYVDGTNSNARNPFNAAAAGNVPPVDTFTDDILVLAGAALGFNNFAQLLNGIRGADAATRQAQEQALVDEFLVPPPPLIVEPFQAGGFLLTDVGDLPAAESNAVTLAIARGLREFAPDFYCDVIGREPEGDFPMIRMQVSNPPGNQVYGGVWFGCNELAPGHTATDAKIFTRPLAGPVIQFEGLFWQSAVLVLIVKHMLDNPLVVRGGGTIQVMGFDYLTDPSVVEEGLGTMHGAFNARMLNDPFLDRTETDLGNGLVDVRITLGSPGPPGPP